MSSKIALFELSTAISFLQLCQENCKQEAFCVCRYCGIVTSAINPAVLKIELGSGHFSCFYYIFMIMLQVVLASWACKNINMFVMECLNDILAERKALNYFKVC
jgi:hypothetical protein